MEGGGVGVGQPGLDQTVRYQLLQIGGGAGLHACRDFLGEEFDQQIGHRWVPFFRRVLSGAPVCYCQ